MTAIPGKFKFLFVINTGSGNQATDFEEVISSFLNVRKINYEIFLLKEEIAVDQLKIIIKNACPDRVIAVGGDGTVRLLASCLMHTALPLGIIPTGSANGMAKELGIPGDFIQALESCMNAVPVKIHLVQINGEICIHLADLGFNAEVVKMFSMAKKRGMWEYFKATIQALLRHGRMQVVLNIKGAVSVYKAVMVVVANGTKYGSGLKINQVGRLDDDLFEVILIKDYSYFEIFSAWFAKKRFDSEKITVFQTHEVKIKSARNVHFQVDGEYMGKMKTFHAAILPNAIFMLSNTTFDEPGT